MIYSVYIHISTKWWHVCIYCDFFYPKSNLFFSVCFPHSLKLKGWPSLGRRTWREMGGFEAKPSCSPPQDQLDPTRGVCWSRCHNMIIGPHDINVMSTWLLSDHVTWHLWCPHIMSWLSLSYIIIMSFDIAIYRWDRKTSHGTRRTFGCFCPTFGRTKDSSRLCGVDPGDTYRHGERDFFACFFCLAKPDKKLFSPYLSVLLPFFRGESSWFMWSKGYTNCYYN